MKEILKSKIMLLFIAFVLGVTYINSSNYIILQDNNNDYVMEMGQVKASV